MKVVAISGSTRKNGNTSQLLRVALEALNTEGIVTELVELAGKTVKGCADCRICYKNKDRRCVIDDDFANELIAKMDKADGILLGSPTYFANVSTSMKALIERAGMVARANDNMHARKVGAGVVAVRRDGAYHVLSSLNAFFLIGEMIVIGSSYWNMGIGRDPGEAMEDAEGVRTMQDLGRNMAWALKKLKS